MARQENILIEENGMLTPEAMTAFVSGQLNAAQTTKVELILANDPFAQEAIEGLKKQQKETTALTISVAAINQKIKEKTGLKETKKTALNFQWINYAFAASVIGILIGLSVWMINYLSIQKGAIAENKTAMAAEQDPMLIPQVGGAVVLDTQAVSAESTQALDAQTIVNTTTNADQAVVANGNTAIAPTAVATESVQYYTVTSDQKNLAEENNAVAEKTVAAAPAVAALKKEVPTSELKAKDAEVVATNPLQRANDAYAKGDYKTAETQYTVALKDAPDNADAMFYAGVSGYINGNLGSAEKNFDQLLKKGSYKDGAKWYKANILIKNGDTSKAKPLLKDLSKANGYYTERANKLLEELK